MGDLRGDRAQPYASWLTTDGGKTFDRENAGPGRKGQQDNTTFVSTGTPENIPRCSLCQLLAIEKVSQRCVHGCHLYLVQHVVAELSGEESGPGRRESDAQS
eukprot:COSAG05_NODE_12_length_37297_cov_117.537072_23_plen_102_part_00